MQDDQDCSSVSNQDMLSFAVELMRVIEPTIAAGTCPFRGIRKSRPEPAETTLVGAVTNVFSGVFLKKTAKGESTCNLVRLGHVR